MAMSNYGGITDELKVEIRATLLSIPGGVLESELCKDFHKLNNYHLRTRNYGYESLTDMMLSMPDVARFEWDASAGANRFFGVVPSDCYLPTFAEKALHSAKETRHPRRGGKHKSGKNTTRPPHDSNCLGALVLPGGASASGEGQIPDLQVELAMSANSRGQYALCIPRDQMNQFGEQTARDDFDSMGDMQEFKTARKWCFVRYGNMESAERAVRTLGRKYKIQIPRDRVLNKRVQNGLFHVDAGKGREAGSHGTTTYDRTNQVGRMEPSQTSSDDGISVTDYTADDDDTRSRYSDSSVTTSATTPANDDPAILSCQLAAQSRSDSLGHYPVMGYQEGPPGVELDEPPELEPLEESDLVGQDPVSIPPPNLTERSFVLNISAFRYNTTKEELLTLLLPFGDVQLQMLNNTEYTKRTKARCFAPNMQVANRIKGALDNTTWNGQVIRVDLTQKSAAAVEAIVKTLDPASCVPVTPSLFLPGVITRLIKECGEMDFVRRRVPTRMMVYVTHIEAENFIWGIQASNYAKLAALDGLLNNFHSDRLSICFRGIYHKQGIWHRVWVVEALPDRFLRVVSVDRGVSFVCHRSQYMFLPDTYWTSPPPLVIPMQIISRACDIQVFQGGIHHVESRDLYDYVLQVELCGAGR